MTSLSGATPGSHRTRPAKRFRSRRGSGGPSVALDRAGITVFRDITFLAAGPASERSRSPARLSKTTMFIIDLRHGLFSDSACLSAKAESLDNALAFVKEFSIDGMIIASNWAER